jgi:hypothetical protein
MFLAIALIGTASAGQMIRLGDMQSGATLLEQDQTGLTMRIDVGEIEINTVSTREGEFVQLTVPGFARSQRIGEPNLPVINRLLSIPFECELRVEVMDFETEEFSLIDYGVAVPIIPVQPSLSKSQNPEDVPFEYQRGLYQKSGYYSLPLAQTAIDGIMRAVRLGRVAVAPIEYDPVANRIKVHKQITVRIDYLHPDWAKTENMRRRNYSPYFEPVYRQLLNYEPLPSFLLDDLVQYPVTYLIVSDRMFEGQLQPFIDWKTMKGFDVIVCYTDEIGYSNNEIKNYLQDLYYAISPAPSFVLLVGDDQQIPAFQFSGHISDLSFCEYTGDHNPEMYYGRFSAQEPSLLQPQINKTLEYEQYLMSEPDFLDDVTLIAGVDGYYAETHGNGQIRYGTRHYFNRGHDINAYVWLYPESDEPGAAGEIIQTVNDGISFINYTAHGWHGGWADPEFSSGNVSNLTNEGQYPLAIGNCCLTNTFGDDYSTPCVGEVWLQSENKGAIGYIGASDNTYWNEDYWWGVGYHSGPINGDAYDYEDTGIGAYDGLFHDHGEQLSDHYIVNDAIIFCGNMAVQESGSNLTYYYWEAYHLMGDPSVMTYLGIPTVNAVDHPEVILIGQSNITITADPYSYVGLSMDGVLHGAVFVGESGYADLEFDPFEIPGTADLVITAQNRQPYITEIPVIAPSGPYVVFDSCMVNDAGGNGDGYIDFGEFILLGMRLVNVGPDPATDVSAALICDDPFVTVMDSLEGFGDIEGDFGMSEALDAYSFEVSSEIPDGHIIQFGLAIIANEGNWESEFSCPARAPSVVFTDLAFEETSGNGNGIFEAGETVEIVITLTNEGGSLAGSVVGALSTGDDYVVIDDPDGVFGDIEPFGGQGDNSDDVFVVTANNDLPQGHSVPFDLALTADGDYSTDIQFSLRSLESFEYNDGGWAGEGEWEWGEPVSGPGAAYDGEKVWATNLAGQYRDDADDYLVTGFYTIESSDASFSFYHWYNLESTFDGGNVLVSTDGGHSWELITPDGGYPDPDVVGLDNLPGFSGQTGDWQEVAFQLGAYEGTALQLGLRLGTDGSVTRDGWYIDAVTVTGITGWQGVPDINVDPTSFYAEVETDDSYEDILTIGNMGEGILAYSITPVTVGLRLGDDQMPDENAQSERRNPDWGKYINHQRDGEMLTVTYEGPKLDSGDEGADPPVVTDYGGPDEFGYMWIDSDEPGGPEFDWVDISGIGEPLTFSDDQNQGPFGLGFDMEFYDGFFNSIRICSNGFISFTSTSTEYINAPIPDSDEPNNLLVPFWDDLNPANGGMIYFYTNNSDSAIVSWVDIPRWSDGGSMTFEAILTADGNITYQYLGMQGTTNSATVGIENSDGSVGLEVVYNSGYVTDGLAVKFMLPIFWLTVDPQSGFNEPGESSEFTVTFDASEPDIGTYTGYLRIDSNDPDDPLLIVPCTLVVSEIVGIDEPISEIPTVFSLGQNYPNPFNPRTRILIGLPESSEITVRIFDLLGREVETLVESELPAGFHSIDFDGSRLSSGVYFYKLEAGEYMQTKRMVLLK